MKLVNWSFVWSCVYLTSIILLLWIMNNVLWNSDTCAQLKTICFFLWHIVMDDWSPFWSWIWHRFVMTIDLHIVVYDLSNLMYFLLFFSLDNINTFYLPRSHGTNTPIAYLSSVIYMVEVVVMKDCITSTQQSVIRK